jgi:hypothetical protein
VIGVGPQVGYIFPVSDEYQGYLNLKGYKEFASDHRADGWNTWLSFSISAAPPSNHGAQGADAGAIWQLRPADHFNGETWHLLPLPLSRYRHSLRGDEVDREFNVVIHQ